MSIFNLKYYFFELDYLKYIILFLLVNWFLEKTFKTKITLNAIVRFILVGGILYFIFIFDMKNKKQINKTIGDKIDEIKSANLSNIYTDADGVFLYSRILEFQKYNYYSYRKSMKHYDNFIKTKNNILQGVHNPKHHYEVMEDEMSKAINALASICLTITPKTTNNNNKSKLKQLEDEVKKLYKIMANHLNRTAVFLRERWANEKTTIMSFPINKSNIKPNMIASKNYSQNYSLF